MSEYHGILVEEGLKDKSILNKMSILGKRVADVDFTLLRVGVEEENIKEIIGLVQKNLVTEPVYYAHFYRDGRLIVIFPERIFKITPDRSTWKEAVEYGKSVGIPEEQLDFHPCRFEDEIFQTIRIR